MYCRWNSRFGWMGQNKSTVIMSSYIAVLHSEIQGSQIKLMVEKQKKSYDNTGVDDQVYWKVSQNSLKILFIWRGIDLKQI